MRVRLLVLSFALALMSYSDANAQSKVGTTAAGFLQIGVGARGVSMGETAVATGRDLSSLYWNPALAADLRGGAVQFSNTQWFAGIDLNYGAAMLDLGTAGKVAVSAYAMTTGEMDVITEERVDGTGEVFRVQDIMFGLTYSRRLTDRFNIGGTAKYVTSQVWNMSASSMAVDVGLTYRTPFDRVVLGMAITNFGTEMQLDGTDTAVRVDLDPRVRGNNDGIVANIRTGNWDLPVAFRFGAAYELMNTRANQLTVSADALYPNNNESYLNAGLEYGIMELLYLRGGYRQLFLADAEGGLSLGTGLAYRGLQADYAFVDRGRLGGVQYVSVGFSF
ncbi:MAG: PorV/PorQ family protein [Bacteroidota bacterium]